MIRNQWYAILESSEVRRGKPVGVTRMGEKLVAWRDSQGQVAVMHDLCPHRGVALSAGEVHGDCIWCPFHGFEYDASGRCTVIPANGRSAPVPKVFKVQTYPTHEAHGFIFIYWGQPEGGVAPPAGSRTLTRASAAARRATPGTRTTRASSRTSSTCRTCPSSTITPSAGAAAR